jgi:MFS family permease
MLFIFRAFQGIGSAICVPGAVGIVGATYHRYNKRKAMAFAIVGAIATTGFLGGILLGGVCAQLLNWRWLFYITAIINGLMIASAFFIVPKMAGEEGHKAEEPGRQKWKEIDWWGQLLSISGLVLLAFSLTYSPILNHLMADILPRLRRVGELGTSSSYSFCPLFSLACFFGFSINVVIEQ